MAEAAVAYSGGGDETSTVNIRRNACAIRDALTNQHSFDENLRLQNLWDGIELMAALLTM